MTFLNGFSRALVAGILAALVLWVLQIFTTLPLIVAGEQLEENLTTITNSFSGDRLLLTLVADGATGVALSLLLFAVCYLFKLDINNGNSWKWFLGFWTAVFFIPAQVLPPTLPGMSEHIDLPIRQIMWVVIVLLASIGLLIQARRAPMSIGERLREQLLGLIAPLFASLFHRTLFKNLTRAFNWRNFCSVLLLLGPGLIVSYFLPFDYATETVPASLEAIFVVRSLLASFVFSFVLVMVFATASEK